MNTFRIADYGLRIADYRFGYFESRMKKFTT